MLQGAEPYRFPGTNDTAVLLIHGYTGSPSELRELGERLHYKGYTVQGLLLNGHGTNPEDLDGVTYEKWTQSVKSAASALKETYGKVVLVGMSMGGLLALDCASTVPVDGVIVISTPIYLFDWRSHFLWLAEKVTRSIPKRPRHIDAPARYDVAYHEMPLSGVREFLRLLSTVKKRTLPRVTAPLLIIQSEADRTVRPQSAQYIYEHAASPLKRIEMLPQRKHVLTLYKERGLVYQKIDRFLEALR